MPDLRGEFLRGTGTGARNTGTGGTVGSHQSATWHDMIVTSSGETNYWIGGYTRADGVGITRESDVTRGKSIFINYVQGSVNRLDAWVGKPTEYTSRPTNTAVLYCMKY